MGSWETIDAAGTTARQYVTGANPGRPGIVLFHAWWGLVPDVTAFADRLAVAGFAVVAPDLVAGKTATTVEEAEELATNADEDLANAVALAAVDGLASRLGDTARIATVGFSFGAHWSIWCGAERDRVAASVVYYGTTGGGHLARSSAPVLGHFAAADPFETEEGVAEFAATATRRRPGGEHPPLPRYGSLVCRAVAGGVPPGGGRPGVLTHDRLPARPPGLRPRTPCNPTTSLQPSSRGR